MKEITHAYLLAGGQSRRMGRDKLFVSIDGQSLLERALETCGGRFAHVSLVAKEREKFQSSDFRVLLDAPEADGPMAGIITALRDCPDEACFITAVDLRDLHVPLIDRLCRDYRGEDYFGVQEPDQMQPLCGVYSVAALEPLLERAATQDYSMQVALESLHCRFVDAGIDKWRNINTPQDLLA